MGFGMESDSGLPLMFMLIFVQNLAVSKRSKAFKK